MRSYLFFITKKCRIYAVDGVSQTPIYIDDREGNLEAAKIVGMNPVLLNSRNVSYEGASVNNFDELAKEILAIK